MQATTPDSITLTAGELNVLQRGISQYVMMLPHSGTETVSFETEYGTADEAGAIAEALKGKQELGVVERGQAERILQGRFCLGDCPKDIHDLWMKLRGKSL